MDGREPRRRGLDPVQVAAGEGGQLLKPGTEALSRIRHPGREAMRRTARPLTALAVAAVVAAAGAGCARTENSRGMNTTAGAGKSAAADQSKGAIPRSGDLCGGTGGVGRIVRIGSDAFTIRRNDDGTSQIIHFTDRATIKTSVGSVSVSDLEIGDRVTLVGNPNPDGSFTANTVVVCARTDQEPQSERRAADSKRAASWSTRINMLAVLLVGLVLVGIVAWFRFKRQASIVFLLFLTVFYVYLVKVLDYTLFQFQSLIVLNHFMPELILRGQEAGQIGNLVPLFTLTVEDLKTSLLNILLTVPFGFGLPFVTNLRFKMVVAVGVLFSIAIELLQMITGLIGGVTFRIADVNDVIFNTIGVSTGCMLFVGFMRIFRHACRNWEVSANPILRYLDERPQA
jgi:glycopeptide antibiotics resistance protein